MTFCPQKRNDRNGVWGKRAMGTKRLLSNTGGGTKPNSTASSFGRMEFMHHDGHQHLRTVGATVPESIRVRASSALFSCVVKSRSHYPLFFQHSREKTPFTHQVLCQQAESRFRWWSPHRGLATRNWDVVFSTEALPPTSWPAGA